jgi:hypothetical protein
MQVLRTALVIGLGWAVVSPAFAGDKSQSTFVNPLGVTGGTTPALTGPIGPSWTNGVSKGKTKGDSKCKVQVKLGGVGLPDSDGNAGTGDEVICTADSHVTVGGALFLATTAVLRGEVKSGKVTIKADLAAEGTGCVASGGGGPGVQQYDGRITCYEPDPSYPPPPLPFVSDPTQGVYPAGFGPRPASPMIATQGLNFAP